MIRNWLIITAFVALFAQTPALHGVEMWGEEKLSLKDEVTEIKIITNKQHVRIIGAAKQQMQVYNLTGICVATFLIDGDDKNISLNLGKGIYILRIGEKTRKIALTAN